jgi:hypothetical protein
VRCRLGSSYRLQLGTVGQYRTLVCAEVDAVDEEGAVVEIKSSPKVSADHQVQNMLCGVSTKIAAVDKKVRARLSEGCAELACRAWSLELASTELREVVYGIAPAHGAP